MRAPGYWVAADVRHHNQSVRVAEPLQHGRIRARNLDDLVRTSKLDERLGQGRKVFEICRILADAQQRVKTGGHRRHDSVAIHARAALGAIRCVIVLRRPEPIKSKHERAVQIEQDDIERIEECHRPPLSERAATWQLIHRGARKPIRANETTDCALRLSRCSTVNLVLRKMIGCHHFPRCHVSSSFTLSIIPV